MCRQVVEAKMCAYVLLYVYFKNQHCVSQKLYSIFRAYISIFVEAGGISGPLGKVTFFRILMASPTAHESFWARD